MKQALHRLSVATRGKGLSDITGDVVGWVAAQGVHTGLLTLWCCHTSASLTVQENADPSVRADILRYFEAIAPEDEARYAHGAEGRDDMPAHLRTMLTQTQLSLPVQDGQPVLGTWQAIYLCSSTAGSGSCARSSCTSSASEARQSGSFFARASPVSTL